MKGLRIVILSASNTWGLKNDSVLVEQVLRECAISNTIRIESVDHIDPISFYGSMRKPQFVDVQIHLEIPCRAAWKWAKFNCVIVNPEMWPRKKWNWVLHEKTGADFLIVKSLYARTLFPEVSDKRIRVLPWRIQSIPPKVVTKTKEFLYIVGGSFNKQTMAKEICRIWRSDWPALHILGNDGVLANLKPLTENKNITFYPFVEENVRIDMQMKYAYHIVTSSAEGFGYTFLEAISAGAIPVWNTLPIFVESYGSLLGDVGLIESTPVESVYRDSLHVVTDLAIEKGIQSVLQLSQKEEQDILARLRTFPGMRTKEFRQNWKSLLSTIAKKSATIVPRTMPPPPIALDDLPNVAILTITHNRPKWFANMAKNILQSGYPAEKLTWIVVDDGDSAVGGRIDEAIMKFQSTNPQIQVKYISLPKQKPIGYKRNKACESAPSDCTVFVNMDDDDHYPSGSVARRIAWLKAFDIGCVYCSTLPMYDCVKYISAINVPPLDLSPAERVSEASFAFTRDFWESRRFPATISVAEGEQFIEGREENTVEIPPEGIIISFLHGSNATSRRVPDQTEPNGCHYGFDDEYFTYLSRFGQ